MKKETNKTAGKIVKILITLSVVILLFTVIGAGVTAASAQLDTTRLKQSDLQVTIYDRYGGEIEDGAYKNYVKISEISENIKNAFIAVEDKRFYDHNGLDYYRMGGAVISNIKTQSFSEGASTITCQLIKNTQLSNEKTVTRKLKEAKMALELEKNYSKDEILELYLNVIYFGNGIYGIGEACNTFFGKAPISVNAAEAAALSATIANPAKYSPLINIVNNTRRRNIVLRLMNEQGLIDDLAYNEAIKSNIVLDYDVFHNNYYTKYAQSTIVEASMLLNKPISEIKTSNIRIYTYYDSDMQKQVFSALNNTELLKKNSNGYTPSGSGILIDNETCGINAFYSSGFYNAYSLYRQSGSTLKPIIYGAAIEKGVLYPSSPILDEKITFDNYAPKNYGDNYYGWVDMSYAIQQSLNIPAVKALTYTGIDYTMDYAAKLGLKLDNKDRNLAMALGGLTKGLNILELSGVYTAYANMGVYNTPGFIAKITDENGNNLYTKPNSSRAIINPGTAYLMTDMLKNVAKSGTAKQLAALNYDIAAKTGTVAQGDGNSDAWCVGYTSANTFCVWLGNESMSDASKLDTSVTGGNQPTKIARQILNGVYKNRTPISFTIPNSLEWLSIDTYALNENHTLMLAGAYTPSAFRTEVLLPRNNTIPISNNFSSQFMSEFDVSIDGNVAKISFPTFEGLCYRVTKRQNLNDNIVYSSNGNGTDTVLFDSLPLRQFTEYYLTCYTVNEDGKLIEISRSAPKIVYITNI